MIVYEFSCSFFVICIYYWNFSLDLQVLFSDLKPDNASEHADLVTDVADSLMALEHYNYALNYYTMLEGNSGSENVW